jgi:hypothetical protein
MSPVLKINARNFTLYTELINTVGGLANYFFNYETEEENKFIEDAKEQVMYPIEDLYNTCKMMSPDENAEYSFTFFEIIRIVLEGISDNVDELVSVFDSKRKSPSSFKDVVIPEELDIDDLLELSNFLDQLYMMVSQDWVLEANDGKMNINEFLEKEMKYMKEEVEEIMIEDGSDDESDSEEEESDEESDNENNDESEEEYMDDESDEESESEEDSEDEPEFIRDVQNGRREPNDKSRVPQENSKKNVDRCIFSPESELTIRYNNEDKIRDIRVCKNESDRINALELNSKKVKTFLKSKIEIVTEEVQTKVKNNVNKKQKLQVEGNSRVPQGNSKKNVYDVGNHVDLVYSGTDRIRKVVIVQHLPDRIFATEDGNMKCFLINKIVKINNSKM